MVNGYMMDKRIAKSIYQWFSIVLVYFIQVYLQLLFVFFSSSMNLLFSVPLYSCTILFSSFLVTLSFTSTAINSANAWNLILLLCSIKSRVVNFSHNFLFFQFLLPCRYTFFRAFDGAAHELQLMPSNFSSLCVGHTLIKSKIEFIEFCKMLAKVLFHTLNFKTLSKLFLVYGTCNSQFYTLHCWVLCLCSQSRMRDSWTVEQLFTLIWKRQQRKFDCTPLLYENYME